jgi:hypothetical protein
LDFEPTVFTGNDVSFCPLPAEISPLVQAESFFLVESDQITQNVIMANTVGANKLPINGMPNTVTMSD